MDVYLEIGAKRTFAGAVEWPGWARSGRDEQGALQALLDYAPRYALALKDTGLTFAAPAGASGFTISERLDGDAATDFGAPGKAPAHDSRPVDDAELQRLQTILAACWQAFDKIASGAQGKELRKGPRGGGRDLEQIVSHVQGGQQAYFSRLGGREADAEAVDQAQARRLVLATLGASVRGEVAERGPRGGLRWTPRYFVRRAAWHVLDHAWEIEDRILF